MVPLSTYHVGIDIETIYFLSTQSKTERHKVRQTDSQIDKQSTAVCSLTDSLQSDRHRVRQTYTKSDIHTYRQKYSHTDRHTVRHTDIQTDRK